MANSIAQMLLFIALLYLLQGKLKEALSDRVVLPPHWLFELVNVLLVVQGSPESKIDRRRLSRKAG
jgi:hypothetical protein